MVDAWCALLIGDLNNAQNVHYIHKIGVGSAPLILEARSIYLECPPFGISVPAKMSVTTNITQGLNLLFSLLFVLGRHDRAYKDGDLIYLGDKKLPKIDFWATLALFCLRHYLMRMICKTIVEFKM